ncbi:MAG: hypothetical protein VX951_09250 [Planctomycetota bacterium]|nr:hypothetical protein [Planctomycetota bacterium]
MILPRAYAVSFIFTLCATAAAQGPDSKQDELKNKLAKKLAGTWIKNTAWQTDLADAKAKSKASGKLIFGYFTRSYAP